MEQKGLSFDDLYLTTVPLSPIFFENESNVHFQATAFNFVFNDQSFIITAHHCVYPEKILIVGNNQEEIKNVLETTCIFRYQDLNTGEYSFKYFLRNIIKSLDLDWEGDQNKDIAIIPDYSPECKNRVKVMKSINYWINLENIAVGETITIVGHPQKWHSLLNNNEVLYPKILKGKITNIQNEEITSKVDISNIKSSDGENLTTLKGASGGPVFIKKNGIFFLIGLGKEFKIPESFNQNEEVNEYDLKNVTVRITPITEIVKEIRFSSKEIIKSNRIMETVIDCDEKTDN